MIPYLILAVFCVAVAGAIAYAWRNGRAQGKEYDRPVTFEDGAKPGDVIDLPPQSNHPQAKGPTKKGEGP